MHANMNKKKDFKQNKKKAFDIIVTNLDKATTSSILFLAKDHKKYNR